MGATSGYNDMTSYDFSHSGCSWCHPGGGGMEYDREGFRYDGRVSGLIEGEGGADLTTNPAPQNGDYFIFGSAAGADASAYTVGGTPVSNPVGGTPVGVGYFVVTSTKGVMAPDAAVNMGSAKMAWSGTAWVQVAKKNVTWSTGGVAEADCMMCHYANQYAQIDRNWATAGYQQPKWAASLGLVGALGGPALITPSAVAGNAANPALGTPTWNVSELTSSMIVKEPRNEGCSACHFFDNAFTTLGPAGKPMGNTAWQKYFAVGAYPDPDIGPSHASYNGGNNIAVWQVAKGKPEGGKRAESINDNNNPDAHMKWPAYSGTGPRMTCSNCHYSLEGTFPALLDGATTIYPAITVQKIDHQFAKGDNLPDGKNMDQLDSTVTCASCHTTRTHPNLTDNGGTLVSPTPAHADLPAIHLEKLDCRVCHIPVRNAKQRWDVADFTVGPLKTFERNQSPENSLGVNSKPLYIWRQSSTSDTIMMEPVSTTTVPVWTDNSTLKPTYQRAAKSAAEAKRTADGYNASNIANFALNQAQGGDTTLIVNTTAEITDMVGRMITASGAATPVMNFYINTFDVSHNIMPKGGKCVDRSGATPPGGTTCNFILGSTQGGGCVMCHSATGQPNSVGFFDKTYTLFAQPTQTDSACSDTPGMHQTTIGGVKRVAVKLSAIKSDGTPNNDPALDLANVADCTAVGNTLNQGVVLGYDNTKLTLMKNFDTMKNDTDCTKCHTVTTAHPTGTNTPTCYQCHAGADHEARETVVAATCQACHDGGTNHGGVKTLISLQAAMVGIHGSAINAGFTTAYDAPTGTPPTIVNKKNVNVQATTTCATEPTYAWTWGAAGTAGSGATTSHTSFNYATGGDKLITMTATCGTGPTAVTASKAKVFTAIAANVPPVPTANVAWDANTWKVTFTDTSTDDGTISSVAVNWGDGASNTIAQNATITHTYKGTAGYTVTQKVTDNQGVSVQRTVGTYTPGYFSISGKVATTSAGTTGIPNATVTLKDSSVPPKVVAIAYTSSTAATLGTFSFTKLTPGTYTMTVVKSPYTITTDPDLTKIVGPNRAGFVIAPNGY